MATDQGSLLRVAKVAISQRKKTDVVEPQVIDEQLLRPGCEELPLCTDPRTQEELSDPINFPKIPALRLSFLNIIEISNLGNFDTLQILHLDNNIIDRIDNLGHLQSLTWLDLSFNNITVISGLDKIANLTDLSLYHNHIEEIKGLDECKNLNILSLGRNRIKNLKEIDKLRPFQNLRCVCFEGNPMCTLDNYNQHVLAYLPTLQYLDYMLIDRKTLQLAQESYQLDELTELKEVEATQTALKKQQTEQDVVLEKLKLSFLDCAHNLLQDLFPTPEPEAVLVLQCYLPLKEDYKEKLSELVKTLSSTLEEKNTARLQKVNAFEKAIKISENESEEESLLLIKQFNQKKKVELNVGTRGKENGELQTQLTELDYNLIHNELQLQECLDEAIDDFEAQMSETIKFMMERSADFFKMFEDLEKMFHTGLLEGAMSEFESFQTSQDLADHDQKKAAVLGNREEIQSTILNINENHTALIANKDDYMQNQMNSWMKTTFDWHRERQYKRNRNRVMEMKTLMQEIRDEITIHDQVEVEEEHDEGEPIYG
eukprot:GEMP01034520.1.p1 GENE.GEMP01034520.1~~GEMP01034520.1.p1  ORF type:complete len:551 (+),score=81.17 GEMP01034520.1:26-1654(+)